MKIIFSRKGFDSTYGGVPSPIFPDGSLMPFPIPTKKRGRPLEEIRDPSGTSISKIVSDLTNNEIGSTNLVHLDPDLQSTSVDRRLGWRPSFGQASSAQQHLANQNVGQGDLFLFFGWYRRIQKTGNKWEYMPNCRGIHCIFGWLQIDEVILLDGNRNKTSEKRPWLYDHPHIAEPSDTRNDTLYLSRETLSLFPREKNFPGAGIFNHWAAQLQLTTPGKSRSNWQLPLWMKQPQSTLPPLTYHGRMDRWTNDDKFAYLKSVAKGQEFVQDIKSSHEAIRWLKSLFRNCA